MFFVTLLKKWNNSGLLEIYFAERLLDVYEVPSKMTLA